MLIVNFSSPIFTSDALCKVWYFKTNKYVEDIKVSKYNLIKSRLLSNLQIQPKNHHNDYRLANVYLDSAVPKFCPN